MYLLFEIRVKVKTFSYSKFHSQLHCQYFDSTYVLKFSTHGNPLTPYHFDPSTGRGLLCCIISIHKNKCSFTKYTKCNNVLQVHIPFFLFQSNLDHHCSFPVGGLIFNISIYFFSTRLWY